MLAEFRRLTVTVTMQYNLFPEIYIIVSVYI